MLKKAASLLLIGLCAGIGAGCKGTQSNFVYAALPSSNELGIYREDPNSGILTQLNDSPFSAGNGLESVVVHPSKKFLYAANSAENTVSLFQITSHGEVNEVTPRTQAGSSPSILAMDPNGAFLYEADRGSNRITVYSIDSSTGALTNVPSPANCQVSTINPCSASIGFEPLNMKVNPAGTVLYVTGPFTPGGIVTPYSINAGVLTGMKSYSTGGANPFGLFIDSSGSHLYVTNAAPDNSIGEFTINSDGTLTGLQGSPIGQTSGSNPLSIVIEPSGKYMYVANEGSASLSGYTIASDGSIDALVTPTFSTSSEPSFLMVDPNDKYLLVGNQSGGIQVFSMDLSTGNLTSVATLNVGSNPQSIAITN